MNPDSQQRRDERVYCSLDSLVRLRHKARDFSFLPKQPVHSVLTGRHSSRLRGRGLDFEELRHYLPGDDIRQMDWKVSSRMKSPFVRVYNEERDRSTLLVVDQRMSMFFGSQTRMKSVVAAELAALAAWRVVAVGDRVGAIVFDDEEIVELSPRRSEKRILEILGVIVRMNNRLAAARPGGDPEVLAEVLRRAEQTAKHDFLVAVISDGTGANTTTRQLLGRIARHNDLLLGFVYDPLEEQLPEAGRLVVSDGALQLELDTSDRKLRQRFEETRRARLDEISSYFLRRDAPVVPIDTGDEVIDQLRRALGMGPRRPGSRYPPSSASATGRRS